MARWCWLALLVSCGDDATTTPDARTVDASLAIIDARPVDAPPSSSPDAGMVDAAPTQPDAPANTPPVITSVSWAAPQGCTLGTSGTFTFTIEATDAETPNGLTYDGRASSCSGVLTSPSDTLTCPNANPYAGSLTVTDPGGLSDTVNFTILPCQGGSAD